MKEILGGELDKAFLELEINAKKTYEAKNIRYKYQEVYQVWELSDKNFEKICDMKEEEWKDDWGWWRSAEGSNMCNPISRFSINHRYIKAWDGNCRLEYGKDYCLREYEYLTEYMCDEIGASMEKNICALAVDLARINGITMGELFRKYQG